MALNHWIFISIALVIIFLFFLSFKSHDEVIILVRHERRYKLWTLITYLLPFITSLLFGYEVVSLVITGSLIVVNMLLSLYWACFLTPKVFKANYTKLFGCIGA